MTLDTTVLNECGIFPDGWSDMETTIMSVDDFYDFVNKYVVSERRQHRLLFDGATGEVYIGDYDPGRVVEIDSIRVPMFENGNYVGIGVMTKFLWIRSVARYRGSYGGDWDIPSLDEIGAVARIIVEGSPKRWKHTVRK